jgi:hypothetical protein
VNQEVLTLVPGGQPLAQSLGFDAAAVVCDNYTSSYLTLPDVGKTIPPWTYGAVVALPSGVRRASAKLTATTPAIPGPPVPASQATLTWTDQPLPADPGHLLQQSQYGSQVVIATVQGGANATVGPTNIAVPAGTMSIGYLVRSDAGNDTPQTVTIQGHQSKNVYASATPLGNTGGAQWFPFSASDTSVDVTLLTNASSPSAIDVLVSPLVEVLDMVQTFGSFINAQLWNGVGNVGALTVDNPSGNLRLLAVSMVEASPAPWQAAASSAPISAAPGALNTDFTIVAGVANTRIYLHAVYLQTNSGTSLWEIDLWDGASSGGLRIARLPGPALVTSVGAQPGVNWDGRGRRLGVGNALVGTIVAGQAGTTVTGVAGYSQA